MQQSAMKAHLFSLLQPPRLQAVKSFLSVLFLCRHATLLSSPLHSPVRLLCSAPSLHLTNPLHQLPHTQIHTGFHSVTYSILKTLSLTCLLPPLQSPVCFNTQKHSPISRLPSLPHSHLVYLSYSLHFHLTPTHSFPLFVLSLPLISPLLLPDHYQFSLTHYLLLVFLLPFLLSFLHSLHLCLCLSSLYILSLCFAFSPSPAAWIYYYLHNGALLIVYELPALRPNKAYFHKKPPFHFSSN